MKTKFPYLFMISGIAACLIYFGTFAITSHYHSPMDKSSDNVTAWWLLCVIMDRWGYFALSVSIYLFTARVKDVRELIFHLIGIAACTISGNDLIDRYCGETGFRPFYDGIMMVLALYSIIKIYKQTCRSL